MKWKCKQSGTVIELPDWEETNMTGHDGYEKVVEEEEVEDKKEQPVKHKAKKEQAVRETHAE